MWEPQKNSRGISSYALHGTEKLKQKVAKIAAKDSALVDALRKKLALVAEYPHHYKNLRAPLQHLKRVHSKGPFVLVFSVNEQEKIVTLEDIDHHDRIYSR